MGQPQVTVVGSVNLDLVARTERLPRPGETVSGAELQRVPGGKGANQAVAAARLGARVRFIGCVGDDAFGREAVSGLDDAGVDLSDLRVVAAPTGVALIVVAQDAENQIVVAPGANCELRPEHVVVEGGDAVLAQLEVPVPAVNRARSESERFFCLNAAPAVPLSRELERGSDLIVVNALEFEALSEEAKKGEVVVTYGSEGAAMFDGGDSPVARAYPPPVDAVDGTAAGDAFCACLVVSLIEGRGRDEALKRACAAGAVAVSRPGAQPSLPTAADVDEILAA